MKIYKKHNFKSFKFNNNYFSEKDKKVSRWLLVIEQYKIIYHSLSLDLKAFQKKHRIIFIIKLFEKLNSLNSF